VVTVRGRPKNKTKTITKSVGPRPTLTDFLAPFEQRVNSSIKATNS